MKQKAYARAGVDIDLGNQVKASLPRLLAATRRPEVLGKVGGFGGLFALDTRKYRQPVLVSSVDGVGTKLKIAFALDRHDTIGQDLVNHCVNDIAVLGAEPLFFLDYLGTGKLEPRVFTEIIAGFAKACAENRCALIGGETAQMPGFYQPGEYDVSGTIVGVVEKSRMLDGRFIRAGDLILGMASSGLHTNGYSLARKLLFDVAGYRASTRVPDLGCTVADELLKVHRSYLKALQALMKAGVLKGTAHITGGGITENTPRILPKGLAVEIAVGSWPVLPVFELLKKLGNVPDDDYRRTFNLGIGMIVVVAQKDVAKAARVLTRLGEKFYEIGRVVKQPREAAARVIYK